MLQSSSEKKNKRIDAMKENLLLTHWCMIQGNRLIINDKIDVVTENFSNFAGFLKALYKKELLTYPKFYKMDSLSKLGFLTSEKLFKESNVLENYRKEDIGIVIFNSSSSLDTDFVYQKTIADKSNYFPSPSVFVYTLPNILIGEICIRHKIKGENAFLVSEKFDPDMIVDHVTSLMESGRVAACLCGWVEVLGDNYKSMLVFVENASAILPKDNQPALQKTFTAKNINNIYHYNGD
jgi:hypothetical protein